MIYEVLNFLRHQLDAFITDGRTGAEPVIVLANPWTNNDSSKNFSFLNSLSLINIEEDRVFKNEMAARNVSREPPFFSKSPELKLNLYILVSAYNKNYEDALKLISKVVGFFQVSNMFEKGMTYSGNSFLPDGVERINVELFTASFEQQNQIWASLSTGYQPSVIYKVRMLVIEGITKTYVPIEEINVTVHQKEEILST